MTTCSRCNGSGTEPDPVAEARARFVEVLTGAQVVIGLKDRFAAAFAAYEAAVRERWHDALSANSSGEPDVADMKCAADVPRLLAAVEAVLALHRPFGIYDECDHEHTDEDVEQGRAVETGDFISCREVWMYDICRECCSAYVGFGQTEECAGEHKHGRDVPICKTWADLSAALLGGES